MTQVVSDSMWELRLYRWLIGVFAVLALLLAAIGLHGVISYNVTSRMREFAVRLALGSGSGRSHTARRQARPAAGWSRPGGRDHLRDGDHAIRQNAADRPRRGSLNLRDRLGRAHRHRARCLPRPRAAGGAREPGGRAATESELRRFQSAKTFDFRRLRSETLVPKPQPAYSPTER